ncbi:transmembrane protein 215 isoform X2 [Zalophus californianus]|uniref:Transmembrane protein 215 isoform X2 n=1 Tax=Zalophus californianus TaxID=9704 RepID=A0A6J2ES37_ZALCA|nr:transmembrane protein 215 isoform X2 [Zalophus californianus]XP_027970926.1 transmembrane protein 215 [Eumetopias jubatus]
MRPDDINPRTGLVVALVSVFLVFGFMFTVSGMKGETLGNIPLLAIGPAICLPGIAAIALARKTEGCTKWPENELLWVRKLPCFRKPKDKEVVELLRTPSDLESGKGSSDELAKKAGLRGKSPCQGQTEVSVATSITTLTPTEGERQSLVQSGHQEETSRYLDGYCPSGSSLAYSALDAKCSAWDRSDCPEPEDSIFFVPQDSIIVCSYKQNSPYDRYCCYINQSQGRWDHETIV